MEYISRLNDSKDCVNILIIETDSEIKTLYKLFFDTMSSNVSYTFIDDIKKTSTEFINNSCRTDVVAKATLNLIKQTLFDLVIIDIKAGSYGRVEIAKEIFKYLPQQRLIFTTTADLATIRQITDSHALSSSIPILQKPFRLSELLFFINSSRVSSRRFETIKLTDHVLASYNELREELEDAADFIKKGISSDESNLLLIRNDMDTSNTVNILRPKGLSNIDILIEDKSLIIMRNEEWYIPDGKVDKQRIINQWHNLVSQSIQSGKKGLRAFCMMDCFFEHGHTMEVVDYERTLPLQFEIPFVSICAYRQSDLDCLPKQEKQKLMECHNHIMIK